MFSVEWTSPLSHVVDTFAKYKGNPSVLESFEKQREISGSKIGQQLGFFPRNRQEELTEARRNFRYYRFLVKLVTEWPILSSSVIIIREIISILVFIQFTMKSI